MEFILRQLTYTDFYTFLMEMDYFKQVFVEEKYQFIGLIFVTSLKKVKKFSLVEIYIFSSRKTVLFTISSSSFYFSLDNSRFPISHEKTFFIIFLQTPPLLYFFTYNGWLIFLPREGLSFYFPQITPVFK